MRPQLLRRRDRIRTIAILGTEEYGLTVGIHVHAAGFMDFEPELERLLGEVDEFDTPATVFGVSRVGEMG